MVLYSVEWRHSKELAKGKGRATSNEVRFVFTVLCRNSSDAYRCFVYYFEHEFANSNVHHYTIDDGEIRMSRLQIDSRNFIAHYLLLDGMREPIYLTDPSSNILRSDRIFGQSRY